MNEWAKDAVQRVAEKRSAAETLVAAQRVKQAFGLELWADFNAQLQIDCAAFSDADGSDAMQIRDGLSTHSIVLSYSNIRRVDVTFNPITGRLDWKLADHGSGQSLTLTPTGISEFGFAHGLAFFTPVEIARTILNAIIKSL